MEGLQLPGGGEGFSEELPWGRAPSPGTRTPGALVAEQETESPGQWVLRQAR